MSAGTQGNFIITGSSTTVEVRQTTTVIVEAENSFSTANDKKSGSFGVTLFVNALIQIIIGGYFHHDCPAQPYIPIYMEVLGTVTMVTVISYWWYKDSPNNYVVITVLTVGLLFCFCFVITGGVWIYSIFPPNYDKSTTHWEPYCNKTLYLFAFIDTTIICGLTGLTSLCCCCSFVYACVTVVT